MSDMVDILRAELRALKESVESGLGAVHRRFDDARERSEERERTNQHRHAENIQRFQRQDDRLESIEADIKAVEVQMSQTNGTIGRHESWLTRHDEQIRSLYRIAKDKIARAVSGSFRKGDTDGRHITQRDVVIALGSVTAGVAVLRFIEWVVKVLTS